jgi:hypothetical protein
MASDMLDGFIQHLSGPLNHEATPEKSTLIRLRRQRATGLPYMALPYKELEAWSLFARLAYL